MLRQRLWLCKLMLNILAIFAMTQTANAVDSGRFVNAGNADFLFVENKVDNEYFVTTINAEPRLRGMNKLSKFPQQPSLGHYGYSKWLAENSIVDIWGDPISITHPFLGLSCDRAAPNCPASGMIPAYHLDDIGFYRAKTGGGVQGGAAPIAVISPTFYEKLRSNRLASLESMILFWCYTQVDYDPRTTRCKDLPNWQAKLWFFNIAARKIGHLTLNPQDEMNEIWVSSDGTAQVKRNFQNCHEAVVAGVDGVVCKILDYKYERSNDVSMNVSLHLDPQLLRQYNPSGIDVRFSSNGTTWWNWTQEATFKSLFLPDKSQISVFMSKSFFRSMMTYGISWDGERSMFSMRFRNTKLPDSEAYQFSTINAIRIVPKAYGISIVSADGQHYPHQTGYIANEKPPIQFDYRITMSAPKFADLVTVQVIGKSTEIKGNFYCLFESADKKLQIPIPSSVIYTNFNGQRITKQNNCRPDLIDLTAGHWAAEPWSNAQGFYYVSNISLKFDMGDVISQKTVDDQDWLGVVMADGMIQVKAQWMGVNRSE